MGLLDQWESEQKQEAKPTKSLLDQWEGKGTTAPTPKKEARGSLPQFGGWEHFKSLEPIAFEDIPVPAKEPLVSAADQEAPLDEEEELYKTDTPLGYAAVPALKSWISKTPGQLQAIKEVLTPPTSEERKTARFQIEAREEGWDLSMQRKAALEAVERATLKPEVENTEEYADYLRKRRDYETRRDLTSVTPEQWQELAKEGEQFLKPNYQDTPEYQEAWRRYQKLDFGLAALEAQVEETLDPLSDITPFDYWRTAGLKYPVVTEETMPELEAKLADPETPREERAKILVAMQMNLAPLSDEDREALSELQSRASLENESLKDAMASGFVANLPSLLKTAGIVTAPTIALDMYEEGHQTAKQQLEAQGLEYDPEKHTTEMVKLAALNSGLEVGANALNLKALVGNPMRSLSGTVVERLANTLGGKAGAYLLRGFGSAMAEGATEGAQQLTNELMAQAVGLAEAEKQGKEFIPKTYEEIKDEVATAAEMGLLVGGGTSTIGALPATVRQIGEGQQKTIQTGEEGTSAPLTEGQEDALQEVAEFKNDYKATVAGAEARTDAEFLDAMAKMSVDSLLSAAQYVGFPAGPVSREGLTSFLLENKDRLPQYQRFLYENFLTEMEKKEDLSALDKDIYKWLAQGDITGDEIQMVRDISDIILERADSPYNTTEELWTGLSERNPEKALRELSPIKGTETQTGAIPLRGQVKYTGEGKFILDLFTRGDMSTLAGEFSQVLSSQLSQQQKEEIISEAIDSKYKDLDKKSRNDFKAKAQRAWTLFESNPASPRFEGNREYMTLLRDTQEYLAEQFTAYLSNTKNAPTHTLVPTFRRMRGVIKRYLKDVRNLPVKYPSVDAPMTTVFNNMLAGESALVSPASFNALIEGKDRSVKVSEATKEARNILKKHLRRAGAEITGLKQQIIDYADTALSGKARKDGTLVGMIEKLQSKEGAFQALNRIDTLVYREQRRAENAVIKEIRSLMSSRNLERLPKEVQKSMRSLFEGINLRSMSPKKAVELEGFRSHLQGQINSGEVSADTLSAPQRLFLSTKKLDQTDLHELSLDVLLGIKDSLEGVTKQELKKQELLVGRRLRSINDAVSTATKELSKNPVVQKRKPKASTTIREQKQNKLLAGTAKSLFHAGFSPVRMLRTAESGVLSDVQEGLVAGALKRDGFIQEASETLRNLGFQQGTKEGSSFRSGKEVYGQKATMLSYKPNEKGEIDRNGPSKEAQVEITPAMLMYLYGLSRNNKALDVLINHGMVMRGEENKRLVFRTREEFFDLIDSLPLKQKQLVDRVIGFYRGVAKRINEVSKRMWGRPIAEEQNYLPLQREALNRGQVKNLSLQNLHPETNQFVKKFIDAQGFLMARREGSSPVYMSDFYEVVSKNLLDVAHFLGMAEPIKFGQAVLFGDKLGDLYKNLETLWGKEGVQSVERWFDRLEDSSTKELPIWRKVVALNNWVKRGIIAFNVPIALQQMASAPLGANYFSAASVREATKRNVFNPDTLGFKLSNSLGEMGRLSPMVWRRFQEDNSVLSQMENPQGQARGLWDKPTPLRQDFSEISSAKDLLRLIRKGDLTLGIRFIRMRDAWALSTLLDAARIEGEKRGWDEEQVVKEWERVIQRTQPMNDTVFQSVFMGDRSAASRLLATPFMSMRDQINGELYENLQAVRYAKLEGKPVPKKAVQNLLRTGVMNAFLVALISVTWSSVGKDDEEKERFLSKTLVKGLLNQVSLLPYIGGPLSSALARLFAGYEADPNGVILLEQGAEILDGVAALTEAGDEAELAEAAIKLATTAAQASGSGIKNLERAAEKIGKELEE